MASLWSFVDICPHHKAPCLAQSAVIGSAFPGRVQSWNSRGCRCVGTWWWGVHTGLPTRCLARLSNTVPSLKYPGLVGLSLSLKLKHESSPGCFSLCAASEGGLCQKHVMETVEGLLCFRELCSCQGSISSALHLAVCCC